MKNKIVLFMWVVSVILSVTACGSRTAETGQAGEKQLSRLRDRREQLRAEFDEEDSIRQEKQTESEEIETDPDGLSDKLSDFQVSIDGVVYQFPMKYSEFEALGWKFSGDSAELLDPKYWDMPADLWYKDGYGAYVVLANPSPEAMAYSDSLVSGIILMDAFLSDCDWEILLPGGIQYGVSTVEDIRAAYGDPTYGNEQQGTYTLTYVYQGDADKEIILSVYGDDKTLKYIDIKNIMGVQEPDIDQELRILE